MVKHPYLFVNPRLQLPPEDTGRSNMKKKAISSECLLTMEDNAAVCADSDPGEAGKEEERAVSWRGF